MVSERFLRIAFTATSVQQRRRFRRHIVQRPGPHACPSSVHWSYTVHVTIRVCWQSAGAFCRPTVAYSLYSYSRFPLQRSSPSREFQSVHTPHIPFSLRFTDVWIVKLISLFMSWRGPSSLDDAFIFDKSILANNSAQPKNAIHTR